MMHLVELVGLTILFTWSTALAPVRDLWPRFLNCSQCIGFWIGFVDGLVDPSAGLYGALLRGASVSTIAFVLAVVMHRMMQDEAATPEKDGTS